MIQTKQYTQLKVHVPRLPCLPHTSMWTQCSRSKHNWLTVSSSLSENAAHVTSPYFQNTSLSRVRMWSNICCTNKRINAYEIRYLFSTIADSLYGVRLQGIMVVVFIKPCAKPDLPTINTTTVCHIDHRGNRPFSSHTLLYMLHVM